MGGIKLENTITEANKKNITLNTKIYFKQSLWQKIKYNKSSYILMAPYMTLFFIFTVLPVIMSIGLGFTYFNMLQMPRFRGWHNYARMLLDDDIFLIAVKNTLIFAFITGPISYVLCFLFAWLINDLPVRLRSVVTTIFYAPSISGQAFTIWIFIFSPDAYGIVNGFLIKWGVIKEPVEWLLNPRYNMGVLILVQLWLSLGAGFLAFIAGLQTVDRNLYEAGSIDGVKNRFQELWYITLPSMVPQLLFGAVMQIVASFAVSEVSIRLAGFPSTEYSAHTVVTHIMDYGMIRYEMGYASAMAGVLFIAMIITNRIVTGLLKKVGH